MTRHLRILAVLLRNCLVREMQFRTNFAIRVLTEVLWLGIMVTFVNVMFNFTDSIAGWNKWQTLILLGTNFMLLSLFEAFFFDGCFRLADEIRQGDLDFVLVKPVNAQFLTSLRYTDYACLFNVLVGLLFVISGLQRLGTAVSLEGLLTFAWLVPAGVAIYYGLVFTLSTLTFWLGRSNNLFDLYWQLGQFGRYPGEIYRFSLRLFLMTVLPMVVVTNFPAKALFEGLPFAWTLYATGLGVLSLVISSALWRRGLARYRSASS